MAQMDVTCATCGTRYSFGKPGQPGSGYGPDGYLPGYYTANTCTNCHPELDGQDDDE